MKTHQSKIEKLIAELCPNGVEFKELGEFCDILNGYAFKSSKYSKSGIRIIRISDVQKSKISNKDLKYYPIENTEEIKTYLLKENDLVMSLTGNVGRVAMLSQLDLPAALNQRVACIRVKNDKVLTRYLFHFFDQDSFEIKSMASATGGGQKNMSTTWLRKFKIPIPPLPIQKEIVRILDKFTELITELTNELTARKKQYSYYRDKLLTFEEGEVEWVPLDRVAKIKHGKDWKNLNTGDVPVYGSGGIMGYVDTYSYDKPTVLIPRKGSITNVFYVDAPFWNVDTIYYTEIDTSKISPKYLYYFIKTIDLMALDTGSGRPSLTQAILNKLQIPVPSPAEQARIVSILDKFDTLTHSISEGLPREIALRQKQYEYYREKLLNFPQFPSFGGVAGKA